MDFSEYAVELLVRQRLAEARALAARAALLDSVRPPRRKLRVAVGLALIRIGQGLIGRAAEYAGDPGASLKGTS